MRTSLLLFLTGSAFALVDDQNVGAKQGSIMERDGCSCDNERLVVNQERADAVKEAFEHSWNGYFQYAFPNDELHPVSNTFGNSRNGWGASAVDALTTAIIMQEANITDTIIDHIAQIDYSSTNETCSLFETTIRYLGGMLAGYDLLTGPFSDLTSANTSVLLDQSVNLANVVKFAFDTSTGIPRNNLNITAQSSSDETNGLATIGTLVLEWVRLSDLTGDASYGTLTERGESYLLSPQPAWAEPFPGLVGDNVNISTGDFISGSGGWIGGSDSFYEYLLKMYVYDPTRFSTYKDRWMAAADSSIQYLASHPATKPDITYLAYFENTTIVETSEHLACFDGGNFILGGLVLGLQNYTDFGLNLTAGCRNTYASTATKIGPEQFSWNASAVPENQTEFWEANGFYIDTSDYDLRPEYLESLYYAYRATGDATYQDWAWEAFQAINATARTDSGFSLFADVNTPGGGEKLDLQESFWFAECLKYAFLINAEDGPFQVNYDGGEQFVFNTEAHPFKVAAAAATTDKTTAPAKGKCACGKQ